MTGWTKGPWVAESGTTTGMMVSAPNATKAKRAVCRNGGPDRDANARLIAAAPDLYDALDELRSASLLILSGAPVRSFDELIIRVDRALAKARGEQS